MKLGYECDEVVQSKEQDPRVRIIGNTLRKTSLDEVPGIADMGQKSSKHTAATH